MDQQVKLKQFLKSVIGSATLYIQPPSTIKMTYPCLICKLDAMDKKYADNKTYRKTNRYSLMYITKDSNDPNIDNIGILPMCRFDRAYTSNNLYHNSYELYF